MPVIYDANRTIDVQAISSPIFADTNVVAKIFFDKNGLVATPPSRLAELSIYQNLIVDMISKAVPLHLTSYTLMELQNVFMRWDHDIYKSMTHSRSIKLKQYRRLPSSMADRKARYPLMFSQIQQTATCHDSSITAADLNRYVDSMDTQVLDPTDFGIADQVRTAHGILITDDGDFDGSGCDLITRNPDLIRNALSNGYTQQN